MWLTNSPPSPHPKSSDLPHKLRGRDAVLSDKTAAARPHDIRSLRVSRRPARTSTSFAVVLCVLRGTPICIMSWSRKKSCSHCRASKARCNKAFPECSRCLDRGLFCLYEGRLVERASPYPTQLHDTARISMSSHHSVPTPVSAALAFGTEPWSASNQLPDTDAFLGCLDLPQDLGSPFTSPGTLQEASKIAEIQFSDIFQNDQSSWIVPAEESSSTATRAQRALTLSTAGIQQTSFQRTLMRRGAHSRCPLTSMVLGQIMSYPRLLIEGDQLPPFIHPKCHVDEELAHDCAESDTHLCLPKTLATCASLVRMFYSRTSADAQFVWETIRAEVDRIYMEASQTTFGSLYPAI